MLVATTVTGLLEPWTKKATDGATADEQEPTTTSPTRIAPKVTSHEPPVVLLHPALVTNVGDTQSCAPLTNESSKHTNTMCRRTI